MAARDVSQLAVGQHLCSCSATYTILKFIGEGCYAKVAKCQVDSTNKVVAVKILKDIHDEGIRGELSMLTTLSKVNSDDVNVLKFYERFECLGCTCLVFELLDRDLHALGQTLHVYQIRPIAKQMLVALQALKALEVIHSDIKADNIMLANIMESPYRCKLIDFGMAIPSFHATFGMIRQAIGYRAPEISLGLPFTEAIDIWGLGCTLAYLYLSFHLFSIHCEYEMMKSMVEMLGMPSDHQLQSGVYTDKFFVEEEDEFGSVWRLLTHKEYSDIYMEEAPELPARRRHIRSLDDLPQWGPTLSDKDDAERMDTREFIDFLKHLLDMDEGQRFTPDEALQHPFITMSHLRQDPGSKHYRTMARAFMAMTRPTAIHAAGHKEMDKAKAFQSSPAAGQCGPIGPDVSENQTDSVSASLSPGEIGKSFPEDLHFYSTEDDFEMQCRQENLHCTHCCDETLDLDNSVTGAVVEDVPEELHLYSTEDDFEIQCRQENLHCTHCCDETLDLDSSVTGAVVEDVPTRTPKRRRGCSRKFFSRIRTWFKPL